MKQSKYADRKVMECIVFDSFAWFGDCIQGVFYYRLYVPGFVSVIEKLSNLEKSILDIMYYSRSDTLTIEEVSAIKGHSVNGIRHILAKAYEKIYRKRDQFVLVLPDDLRRTRESAIRLSIMYGLATNACVTDIELLNLPIEIQNGLLENGFLFVEQVIRQIEKDSRTLANVVGGRKNVTVIADTLDSYGFAISQEKPAV